MPRRFYNLENSDIDAKIIQSLLIGELGRDELTAKLMESFKNIIKSEDCSSCGRKNFCAGFPCRSVNQLRKWEQKIYRRLKKDCDSLIFNRVVISSSKIVRRARDNAKIPNNKDYFSLANTLAALLIIWKDYPDLRPIIFESSLYRDLIPEVSGFAEAQFYNGVPGTPLDFGILKEAITTSYTFADKVLSGQLPSLVERRVANKPPSSKAYAKIQRYGILEDIAKSSIALDGIDEEYISKFKRDKMDNDYLMFFYVIGNMEANGLLSSIDFKLIEAASNIRLYELGLDLKDFDYINWVRRIPSDKKDDLLEDLIELLWFLRSKVAKPKTPEWPSGGHANSKCLK